MDKWFNKIFYNKKFTSFKDVESFFLSEKEEAFLIFGEFWSELNFGLYFAENKVSQTLLIIKEKMLFLDMVLKNADRFKFVILKNKKSEFIIKKDSTDLLIIVLMNVLPNKEQTTFLKRTLSLSSLNFQLKLATAIENGCEKYFLDPLNNLKEGMIFLNPGKGFNPLVITKSARFFTLDEINYNYLKIYNFQKLKPIVYDKASFLKQISTFKSKRLFYFAKLGSNDYDKIYKAVTKTPLQVYSEALIKTNNLEICSKVIGLNDDSYESVEDAQILEPSLKPLRLVDRDIEEAHLNDLLLFGFKKHKRENHPLFYFSEKDYFDLFDELSSVLKQIAKKPDFLATKEYQCIRRIITSVLLKKGLLTSFRKDKKVVSVFSLLLETERFKRGLGLNLFNKRFDEKVNVSYIHVDNSYLKVPTLDDIFIQNEPAAFYSFDGKCVFPGIFDKQKKESFLTILQNINSYSIGFIKFGKDLYEETYLPLSGSKVYLFGAYNLDNKNAKTFEIETFISKVMPPDVNRSFCQKDTNKVYVVYSNYSIYDDSDIMTRYFNLERGALIKYDPVD